VNDDFLFTALPKLGRKVFRLGLSASYRPGSEVVCRALNEGVYFFFCYGFDTHMTSVLRHLSSSERQKLVIATGPYNLLLFHPNLRRTLERRLRQLRTDYIDVFLFLGLMGREKFISRVLEELRRFREEGKVRAIGISTHDRELAGTLAAQGAVDALMIRYSAAHRGAEQDVFPYLAPHQPAVISYTATRWARLMHRPRGWPEDRPIATPGMAYRFVLSSPHVHICLTAPSNLRQFEENLAAVHQGPLTEGEMQFMREFGDAVYRAHRWFM